MAMSFDVAVFGGGPAGCATAIALRRLGHSCLIVERSNFAEMRVGETLPPAARRPLAALGLWDRFLEAGHLPSVAIDAAWKTNEPQSHEFIFNPYGNAWHLDRRRFDASLADEAQRAGAEVFRSAQLLSCEVDGTAGWHIEVAAGSSHLIGQARFVVDATGRAAAFARKQGAKRDVHDYLIGVTGRYRALTPEPAAAGSMLLEAVETGWWYCAPLPDARLVLTFMTDGDLHARAGHAGTHDFARSLLQTTHALTRVHGFALENSPGVMAANSSLLSSICGPNWLAVGDAAATYDPLSGQGILKALESGILASLSIGRHLAGDSASIVEYATKVRSDFDRYLALRNIYYAKGSRWPKSPFWQRRCSPNIDDVARRKRWVAEPVPLEAASMVDAGRPKDHR